MEIWEGHAILIGVDGKQGVRPKLIQPSGRQDKDKGLGQDKDKGLGQDEDKGLGQDEDKSLGQDEGEGAVTDLIANAFRKRLQSNFRETWIHNNKPVINNHDMTRRYIC
jgi:hypothetical protein